jgi:hypothetical protein
MRSASSENSTASPSKAMRTRQDAGHRRRTADKPALPGSHRQRRAHVAIVGRQEKMGAHRSEVKVGRPAAREHAAFDRQPRRLGRTKHAQARDRIVARQNHHLDAAQSFAVESEQLLHQRKRGARPRRLLQAIQLHGHVGGVVAIDEHPVLLLEVEQGARGQGDDEFSFKGDGHGDSLGWHRVSHQTRQRRRTAMADFRGAHRETC